MGSNSFGSLFKVTTWGESHGPAIGCVIDGCPAGIEINEEEINEALKKRAPGKNAFTSPRNEKDEVQILSGVFEGSSTGAPISLLIHNHDGDSSKYEPIKNLLRPGHANYTYLEKYGCFDYRGGGRSSARETACRVAAGAIAKKFLKSFSIETSAKITQIGTIQGDGLTNEMIDFIELLKKEGDSTGGIITFEAIGMPVGLGDPIYEKLEANLAKAMLSINASKGFEIGSGFRGAEERGSLQNDLFEHVNEKIMTKTNHSGGVLGGISNGMPLWGRVAFKPTSSIQKPMQTLNRENEEATFQLPEGSRHDPCVAIRAVPVVDSMLALVLADSLLMKRMSKC